MRTLLLAMTLIAAPAFARNNCNHAPRTSEEYGLVAKSTKCNSGYALDGKCLRFLSKADQDYLAGVVDYWGGSVEMGLCIQMNLENGSLLLIDYPRYTD